LHKKHLAVVEKIDKFVSDFPLKKVFTRNTIYRKNNQVCFFYGLYKLKFGVVCRHQKTLDFNLFLVIFIHRFGEIPFLMKKKYGIILRLYKMLNK